MLVSKSTSLHIRRGFTIGAVLLTIASAISPWLSATSEIDVSSTGYHKGVTESTIFLYMTCSTVADTDTQCQSVEIASASFASVICLVASGYLSALSFLGGFKLRRELSFAASIEFLAPTIGSASLNALALILWLFTYAAAIEGDVLGESKLIGFYLAIAAMGCTIASVVAFGFAIISEWRSSTSYTSTAVASEKLKSIPVGCLAADTAFAIEGETLSSISIGCGAPLSNPESPLPTSKDNYTNLESTLNTKDFQNNHKATLEQPTHEAIQRTHVVV